MSEVYELATIADLLKIPPDKLSECLRDIEYAINLCHFAGGDEAAGMSFDAFTWTDDGKHSVNMAMNGEPFLTLDVTESRAPVQASEARGDDTKRLDWLSADGEDRTVYIAMDERWSAQDGFACYGGDTLREAIDAAMSSHTQAGPVG